MSFSHYCAGKHRAGCGCLCPVAEDKRLWYRILKVAAVQFAHIFPLTQYHVNLLFNPSLS